MALEGGEWSAARPGHALPPGKTRYPFYSRLGGPQGLFGWAENLIPTGIRSRTVQSVVSCYTDWATWPTLYLVDTENEFSVCFLVWGICIESAVQISDTKCCTDLLIGFKVKMNTTFGYCEKFWNNFCLIGNAVYLSSWLSNPGLGFLSLKIKASWSFHASGHIALSDTSLHPNWLILQVIG